MKGPSIDEKMVIVEKWPRTWQTKKWNHGNQFSISGIYVLVIDASQSGLQCEM